MLAGFHADLGQRRAIVRAHALTLGQFVAHDLPRQRRIQRLAAALGALVSGNVNLVVRGFLGHGLRRGAQLLGFVEEQVLLVRGVGGFALGVEELALEAVELLLEQVALGAQHAQFAREFLVAPGHLLAIQSQLLAARDGIAERLAQGFDLVGGGHANHRRAFCSGRAPMQPRSSHPAVTVPTRRN